MCLQCLWTWLNQSKFRETIHFINEVSQNAFITLRASVQFVCEMSYHWPQLQKLSRTQLFLQRRSEILIEAIAVTPATRVRLHIPLKPYTNTAIRLTHVGYSEWPHVYTHKSSALLICGVHQPPLMRNSGQQHLTLWMNSFAGNFQNISLWQPVKPNFTDTES